MKSSLVMLAIFVTGLFADGAVAADDYPSETISLANTYTGYLVTDYDGTDPYAYSAYSYDTSSDYDRQNWKAEYIGKGYLRFKNEHTTKCLTYQKDGGYAKMEMCSIVDQVAHKQHFKPVLVGGGSVQLQNKSSDSQCLSIYSCNSSNCSLYTKECDRNPGSGDYYISARELWSMTVPRGAGKELKENVPLR